MSGILSGPNDLDDLSCLVAVFNSSIERRVLMSGSLDFLPSRFLKWLDQFLRRFLADPPFRLTFEVEFLPESSLTVFQAR